MQNSIYLMVLGAVVILAAGGALLLLNQNSGNQDTTDTAQNMADNSESNGREDTGMEQKNIVQTAIDTPALSTLVAAVQAGGLVEALSDESAQLTVFAPTNDAFAAIQSTVDTLLLPENLSQLQNVLQYHVVAGKVMSTDLTDGMEVTALNGDTLTIRITNGNVFINDSQVVIADVETSNGVVHVINKVLVP